VIVCHIKGENWQKTAAFRTQAGHPCSNSSPWNKTIAPNFNPLEEVRTCSPWDVSDAQNMAQKIKKTGEENPPDLHRGKAATSLATSMIVHVY
jgi:type IV secretory pathway TraG/TraD family ATPase VirD4